MATEIITKNMLKTYSQKIAYNTGVQVIGKAVTTVLSLILIALLTRYLGVFGFGEYTTVFVFLSFFGVIADFGFFQILVREMTNNPEEEGKIANNLLTFRAFFALAIYLLAIFISLFTPYSATIKEGILLIALASFFQTQNSSLVGIFQVRHRMDRSVITDVVGRATILLISIWLIKQGAGLQLIFWATVIGNLINLILSWILAIPIVKIRLAFDFKLWKKIFVYAWPLGIAAVFGIIYFKIDSIMLSLLRSSEDVGIYGAPYKILEVLVFIPGIFMGNVFPVITRYVKEKDERLQSAIQKSFTFLLISATGILFGGLALSSGIIRFVAGEEFVSSSTITFLSHPITAPILFQILLVAIAFSYISYLFNPILLAVNQQKALIKPAIYATIINVALNLIFIPKYGYLAAASTTVVTELFILIYLGFLTFKFLPFGLNLKNLWKVLLSGILMGAILYFLNNLNIIVLVILGVGLYIFFLFIFKVIGKGEISALFFPKGPR